MWFRVVQVQSGYNYHFPRAGQCVDGQAIGTNGCTWKQLPQARMLYGDDLLAAGWDSKFVADTPTNQSHTLANVAAFKVALEQCPADRDFVAEDVKLVFGC